MTIFFNGTEVSVSHGVSLLDFLATQNMSEKKGIAVAVNNNIVIRANWSGNILIENDKVLVISATKGG